MPAHRRDGCARAGSPVVVSGHRRGAARAGSWCVGGLLCGSWCVGGLLCGRWWRSDGRASATCCTRWNNYGATSEVISTFKVIAHYSRHARARQAETKTALLGRGPVVGGKNRQSFLPAKSAFQPVQLAWSACSDVRAPAPPSSTALSVNRSSGPSMHRLYLLTLTLTVCWSQPQQRPEQQQQRRGPAAQSTAPRGRQQQVWATHRAGAT